MTDLGGWFRRVVDFFKEHHANVFIHGSTLLGVVRSGQLLHRMQFDKELNFGIKSEDLSLQLLVDMEKEFPYFLPMGTEKKNSLIYFGPEPIEDYLSVGQDHWQMEPGIGLLAVFWRGKSSRIELMGQGLAKTWPLSMLEEFTGVDLAHRRVSAPANVHSWLEHYFGDDYMVENQDWHWISHAKNLETVENLKKKGEL